MTIPTLSYETPGNRPPRRAFTLVERIAYIAIGVVLPILCFVEGWNERAGPDWQFARPVGCTGFLLGRESYAFFPLLLLAMAALCAFAVRPRLARSFILRAGLITGVVLALQYLLILASIDLDSSDQFQGVVFVLAVPVGLGSNFVLLGIVRLLERVPPMPLLIVMAVTFLVGIVAGVGAAFGTPTLIKPDDLWGPVVVCGPFAPAWCLGVYTRAAIKAQTLNRESGGQSPRRATRLAAILAWLMAYSAAWKWSVANALTLYAALPTTPPQRESCYIATAAAAGHPRFVGSKRTEAADGKSYRVNGQLRRLKCVEIALAAICPFAHRAMRSVYDFIGPPLARVIGVHPLLADLAFVALSPIEWIAYALLIVAVPQVRLIAHRLYP